MPNTRNYQSVREGKLTISSQWDVPQSREGGRGEINTSRRVPNPQAKPMLGLSGRGLATLWGHSVLLSARLPDRRGTESCKIWGPSAGPLQLNGIIGCPQ
ncbi:predicted protein [Histoplasma capsulatum G186AR]|uniref:Uncharacterized protein n=1 Tax=Ajellomyces capsulatus (strain G186AR / H82 / ATCC MYA-2454 / RMSCC 2432) TaxID=447093 RepID=C0NJ28_AJECG|nr:uncharacterized protein HCBG_03158 [Histoplasma capsulatum G186AR]EEH07869.1 predicted protein [Histoplasma capsulatum G186AR]